MDSKSTDEQPVTALTITPSAAEKVAELIAEEGDGQQNLVLRIYVQGGGCAGFQYGFAFEEAVQENDTEIVTEYIKVVIDPVSLPYLNGAEIDYIKDLDDVARLIVRNPNARKSCGCGSSFSL
jgi:iron-sulfur cluster insertion protein